MDPVSERYRRAAALRLSDQRAPTLARLLISSNAPPPVTSADFSRAMPGATPWLREMDTAPPALRAPSVNPRPAPPMPTITTTALPPPAAMPGEPMPAPVVPDLPPPTQIGDVKTDVLGAIQKLWAAGKLPEQWRGAFSNQYGEPG